MGVVEEWESGGGQGDVPPGMVEPGPERDSGKRDYTQMRSQASDLRPEVRLHCLRIEHFVHRFSSSMFNSNYVGQIYINIPNGDAQVGHGRDGYLRCCDTLDWTNTLQMKMYQEWQRRDDQQRKLKRRGNGMKETPKMHPNRFSDG